MRTRRTNKTLLRERIAEFGLEVLAVKSGCSASLLQKMASNSYEGSPSMRTVDGLCYATREHIDDLFPVCETVKETA